MKANLSHPYCNIPIVNQKQQTQLLCDIISRRGVEMIDRIYNSRFSQNFWLNGLSSIDSFLEKFKPRALKNEELECRQNSINNCSFRQLRLEKNLRLVKIKEIQFEKLSKYIWTCQFKPCEAKSYGEARMWISEFIYVDINFWPFWTIKSPKQGSRSKICPLLSPHQVESCRSSSWWMKSRL